MWIPNQFDVDEMKGFTGIPIWAFGPGILCFLPIETTNFHGAAQRKIDSVPIAYFARLTGQLRLARCSTPLG